MDFARNKLDTHINGHKKSDEFEFINIYKRDYGMPATSGNQTDVTDYILKLIDYKNTSDELSGDECNQRHRTNQLIQEIKTEQIEQVTSKIQE